jgi:hypothetical protein
MITRSERPRRRTVLEIAIAVSIAIHLLLGAAFFPLMRALARTPQPKESPPVALSDVVTIEKRAVPHPEPRAQREVTQPRKPAVVAVTKQPQLPRPQQPVREPRKAVAPAQRTERQELADTKAGGPNPVASSGPHREGTPHGARDRTEVALAPPQPQTPSLRSGPFTQQDLAALQRQFANTIAQARQRSNPLDVPTNPPSGAKRYRLQMKGIYGALHDGQGVIDEVSGFARDGFNYYYMSYEIVYQDGTFEQGNVPWPSRWPSSVVPEIEQPGWHGPMPCPAPGYSLPSVDDVAQMKLAIREALHVCFPDHYPSPE